MLTCLTDYYLCSISPPAVMAIRHKISWLKAAGIGKGEKNANYKKKDRNVKFQLTCLDE